MQKLSSRKLGFEVYLERPYKCCDLKPAYGVIFEEYLTAYSYWGHCDFDLIFGDLQYFAPLTNKNKVYEYCVT